MHAKPDGRGFTLIEMLVAMVLLSLLATTGYRSLNAVLETDGRARIEQEFWQQLAGSWGRISADLQDAVAVPLSPASRGVFITERSQSGAAAFTLSRQIPADAGGGTQVVSYRYADGRLVRAAWRHEDANAARLSQVVLERIDGVQFRYMDTAGRWLAEWNPLAGELPRAVEFQIAWPDGRFLRRVFRTQ